MPKSIEEKDEEEEKSVKIQIGIEDINISKNLVENRIKL